MGIRRVYGVIAVCFAVVVAALVTLTIVFGISTQDTMTPTAEAKSTPASITLSKKKVMLKVGETCTITVKSVKPANASKAVTWKSLKKSVAHVSKKGVVTAKKAGKATITARAKNGTATAKVRVVVRDEQAHVDANADEGSSDDGVNGAGGNMNGTLKTTTFSINGADFKMTLVEHGSFTMGSGNTGVAYSESPAHKVTLTRDYLMSETEVTNQLWNAVMGKSGGNTKPKTSVTWSAAHDFIDTLNDQAHASGLIGSDVNFHLPTEAQWEFAAKGGNASKGYTYAGSNNIDDVAVTYENSGSDAPIEVKTKQPNELGLYDMSGNAYEWVDDYAGSYSADDAIDPQNTTKSSRYVKRGGSNYHSFSEEGYLFTTTGRYFYGSTDWTIGFRICLW